MRRGARATLLVVWLLALAALGWMVAQRLKISTDLRSFMPAPTTPDQRLLMEQVGEGPGSRLLLLSISGAPDEKLAALSQGLLAALKKDPRYSQVVNGGFDLGALDSSLLPYRFLLSPTLDTQPLDEAYLADQLQQRLDDLSSPAASLLKGLLPRDPTLEVLKLAELWAPAKSPEVREGVWFSPQDEALLLVQTVAAGFDPGAQEQSIDGIRQAFAALPGSAAAKLDLSGPGYFSVVVGAQTRHQADWIGRISTVGFIALLLLAYRSFSSLLLGALPIASAALAGIAALTLAFPDVHGITLAFGFTLLGVAQEYPIRVLSHRRAGEDAVQSVRALWPLLLTAIASACIAYLAFYASGVNGLKQLAVFTIVGLLVAGFSTRYLLPHLLPRRVRDVAGMAWLARARRFVDQLPRPRWIPLLVAVAIVAMLALARGSFWQNNLAALTPLPQDLLQHDARLREALGAPDVRYLLVLQAPTEQGVLALSERLQPQVDALVAKHAADALELPSRYLPSIAVQRERQAKLPDRATLQHALDEALHGLPFRADLFQPFVDDVETARSLPPLTPERYAQTPLGQRLAAMLVERDGHWLGLGTVSGVHDVAALQSLGAGSHGSVRLLDLKAASESLVVDYRTRILQALLAASLLLVLTISFALRSVRRAWHVLAPMTLATFLVLAVERVIGIEISLFHLVALILAGGLGLHYALFFERDTGDPAEQRRTLHATIVCVLSALLVFGMLAWATIPVLRAIGLTVSLGVAFHFCLSILMAPHAAEE
ncbi:MMPL family transporter [Rhodanobacter sp. FDAARGOS 1247]|uniref:MMPL family transporter n=1 Tax=Rhodanobacter sp. FDAARGOS 1247 TaxID=2778082 RepID=UPI00194FB0E0|nr:MMPL family transporter [Rhodanobacter sp. FDAARGOS 1247]QRP63751.1 MMPL family transporter [Rhodanobacter sp. FDAARGOS 1247]